MLSPSMTQLGKLAVLVSCWNLGCCLLAEVGELSSHLIRVLSDAA